ncbi:DNA-binding response regulator [Actinoalloteichus sp. AHMU CJ021]|uniref:Two component transcriptional regulator, LuxR family n=1 Tax=Actinoalloteichus caeruleus DSM 43889 TaxID=1120930 RepID=A0ABT1JEE0_ACTCY|nr:response regulator transcription factor [Actinoalloteichus caeruleus]AUS77056.1 DNA-binding response regulator [Actinoalloteichus sp. AHMU CJ021]MCP2330863.1 two component transcriptional regulator, LuxR family [Actinoalloteichus caeruleus DSM 43889]
MSSRPVRIVLAEDSLLIREGLTGLLTRLDHEVVAAVENVEGLVAAVDEHRPDLVITDVRMPPGYSDEGLRAAVRLRRDHPDLAVLVLSQYVATAYTVELFGGTRTSTAGLGYLLKDRIGEVGEFAEAISRVAGGGMVIDPEVVRQMMSDRRKQQSLAALTARELEVLGLMARGGTNNMISRQLHISEAGVAKHVGNIFHKLGLNADDGHRRVLAVLTYLRDA